MNKMAKAIKKLEKGVWFFYGPASEQHSASVYAEKYTMEAMAQAALSLAPDLRKWRLIAKTKP